MRDVKDDTNTGSATGETEDESLNDEPKDEAEPDESESDMMSSSFISLTSSSNAIDNGGNRDDDEESVVNVNPPEGEATVEDSNTTNDAPRSIWSFAYWGRRSR